MELRLATTDDAAAVAEIYRPIVASTPISLEVEPPDTREMQRRIDETLAAHAWPICEHRGDVAGYAYASRASATRRRVPIGPLRRPYTYTRLSIGVESAAVSTRPSSASWRLRASSAPTPASRYRIRAASPFTNRLDSSSSGCIGTPAIKLGDVAQRLRAGGSAPCRHPEATPSSPLLHSGRNHARSVVATDVGLRSVLHP